MKQRYICCAYISTNSKIYDILHPPPLIGGSLCHVRCRINELID